LLNKVWIVGASVLRRHGETILAIKKPAEVRLGGLCEVRHRLGGGVFQRRQALLRLWATSDSTTFKARSMLPAKLPSV
jgi:hypothetical protein